MRKKNMLCSLMVGSLFATGLLVETSPAFGEDLLAREKGVIATGFINTVNSKEAAVVSWLGDQAKMYKEDSHGKLYKLGFGDFSQADLTLLNNFQKMLSEERITDKNGSAVDHRRFLDAGVRKLILMNKIEAKEKARAGRFDLRPVLLETKAGYFFAAFREGTDDVYISRHPMDKPTLMRKKDGIELYPVKWIPGTVKAERRAMLDTTNESEAIRIKLTDAVLSELAKSGE